LRYLRANSPNSPETCWYHSPEYRSRPAVNEIVCRILDPLWLDPNTLKAPETWNNSARTECPFRVLSTYLLRRLARLFAVARVNSSACLPPLTLAGEFVIATIGFDTLHPTSDRAGQHWYNFQNYRRKLQQGRWQFQHHPGIWRLYRCCPQAIDHLQIQSFEQVQSDVCQKPIDNEVKTIPK